MSSVVLTTPAILVLSVFAVIISASVAFIKRDNIRMIFFIASFLIVMANVVYMFLLGAQWKEALVYVLFFLFVQCAAAMQSQRCTQEEKSDVIEKGLDGDSGAADDKGAEDDEERDKI